MILKILKFLKKGYDSHLGAKGKRKNKALLNWFQKNEVAEEAINSSCVSQN